MADPSDAVLKKLHDVRDRLLVEVRKVIIGQSEVVEQIVIALFGRGHGLIVGVPGLAKTLMVSTVASVLDLKFRRIQFTPDLMPSDITGTEVLAEGAEGRGFKFLKGPVFCNILLADEINRTPPKTQAALLEAMQEHHVTAGGTRHRLPEPFFVLATQNPIEQEGTYPLPEAQLDRFMFQISIGYPSREEELQIIAATTKEAPPAPAAVLRAGDILAVQDLVRRVPVSPHVVGYATDLVRATRPHEREAPDFVRNWLTWGAGPRAAQYLVIGAKARALLAGRMNVSVADVRALALPVLRHRLFTNFTADSENVRVEDVIARLIETVPEPKYER